MLDELIKIGEELENLTACTAGGCSETPAPRILTENGHLLPALRKASKIFPNTAHSPSRCLPKRWIILNIRRGSLPKFGACTKHHSVVLHSVLSVLCEAIRGYFTLILQLSKYH